MKGALKLSVNLAPLKKMIKKDPDNWKKAAKIGAIQFLTWANTGSSKDPSKPPIRFGVLRGSSSAFVGNELVSVFQQDIKPGGKERPTPNKQHTAPVSTITWGWNTAYAAKMHEWKGNWGPFTTQDGSAGAKWIEKHIASDKDTLFKVIAIEYKKVAGT